MFIQRLVLNPVLAQVMENLESHEIKEFNFPGLKSHGPEFNNTVKPVLSGHRIKWTPSIKRTVAKVPKFISLIYFK